MLSRKDRTLFVTQAIRFSLDKAELSARKLTALSKEYGQYACILFSEQGGADVIFSEEQGNLIGENIVEHLDSDDFIYCEILPNAQILLLVVASGRVLHQALLSMDTFLDEFEAWQSEHLNLTIHYYGDNVAQLILPVLSDADATIESLDHSVFTEMAVDSSYYLTDLPQAMSSAGLIGRSKKIIFLSLVVIGFIAVGLYAWHVPSDKPTLVQAVNPYQSYQNALRSESPTMRLIEISNAIALAENLPYWDPTNVTWQRNNVAITLKQNQKASLSALYTWTKEQGILLEQEGNTLVLDVPLQSHPRAIAQTIYPARATLYALLDELNVANSSIKISIGAIKHQSNYQVINVTLRLDNFSTTTLSQLAADLKNYPLVLDAVNLSVQDGLIGGVIDLNVLGA